MAISVASALVSSRLDQVNPILYGAASKHINRLQRVQNALARVVTYQRPYASRLLSTALFQKLQNPLNGDYISNWPPWHRHCTLASHLTCLNCYSMNPHKLCDLLLYNSLFHDKTLNLARMHIESAPKMLNLVHASRAYQ